MAPAIGANEVAHNVIGSDGFPSLGLGGSEIQSSPGPMGTPLAGSTRAVDFSTAYVRPSTVSSRDDEFQVVFIAARQSIDTYPAC